jgi:O-antigen/teichoic acid export membrane protein
LFENISLAVVLNLMIKTAWILTNNVVQDRVGHTEFGMYLALYSFGFLFLALADMGINQYTTKTLAAKPEMLRKLFPSLLSLKVVLSSIYPFLVLGAGWMAGYRGEELYLLFILSFVHGILQLNFFFRANFQAFQKFSLDAFASVLDRILMLGIVLFLLVTGMDLEGYILAYLASAGLTLGILVLFSMKLFGWMRMRLEPASSLELVRLSFPFALITILYSVNDKVDQVLLERLIGGDAGKHQTGLYGGAYRWVDTVMMYLWTVLPIFFAKFAHHVHDEKALGRLLAFGQPIAAIPMFFAGFFGLIYGEKLLFQFTHSTPEELATMTLCLKILFVAVIVNGVFAIYSTLLTSTNHERFVSWMIGVSILLNVTLNCIFIPRFGALAAACNTVVSFCFLSVSYIWFIHYRLPIAFPWKMLVKLLGVGALFGLGFWGMSRTTMPWWLVSGLSGLLLLGLAYFAGLLRMKLDDDAQAA